MLRAINLAKKGIGWTESNPIVGAVLVKNGKIIGESWHKKFGGPHAEIGAFSSAQTSIKGATLYTNLEPCCHHGKTKPCTDAIIQNKLKKVIFASGDNSEKVNGKGEQILIDAGIEVLKGCMKKKADEINKIFLYAHEKKLPWLTLKMALSLDGKIAAKIGDRTQISGEKAQIYTHKLRQAHQAILIGSGTVISDNPHLGVRLVKGRDPLRVIMQGKRDLDKNSLIFRDENFLILKNQNPKDVLLSLYDKNINSVLIEGGQKISSAFLKAQLVNEIQIILSPLILGEKALDAFTEKHMNLSIQNCKKLGEDVLLSIKPIW